MGTAVSCFDNGDNDAEANESYHFWKVLDGPELDEPEIFWKQMPKSINELWRVFKLINKLPNNYKKIQIAPLRGASGIEIVIIG